MMLLVCGSRDWSERRRPIQEIARLEPDVVIHGAAGKTDPLRETSDNLFAWLAERWAFNNGRTIDVIPFPADWSLGRKAGPLRNARMIAMGCPDRGLAFGALVKLRSERLTDGLKPTGTGDMVGRMLAAGLPVRWVPSPDALAVDLTEMPEPPK